MDIQDSQYDLLGRMPIFLNPTFDEVMILVNNQWDTIRILRSDESLVLASGYGNTHSSMIQRLRLIQGRNLLDYDSYILYYENQTAYFNLEDVSGNGRAKYNEWRRLFTKDQVEILKDLIRESGLTLV